jgi:hypothetical protein
LVSLRLFFCALSKALCFKFRFSASASIYCFKPLLSYPLCFCFCPSPRGLCFCPSPRGLCFCPSPRGLCFRLSPCRRVSVARLIRLRSTSVIVPWRQLNDSLLDEKNNQPGNYADNQSADNGLCHRRPLFSVATNYVDMAQASLVRKYYIENG